MNRVILLVDDDPRVAQVIRDVLLMTNHEILVAESLAQAIKMISSQHFDAALVDLSLPDAKGMEAVDTLTRLFPHLPTIVITGSADKLEEALLSGAQEFLVKGQFTTECMTEAIAAAIIRHRVREKYAPLNNAIERATTTIETAKKEMEDHKRA